MLKSHTHYLLHHQAHRRIHCTARNWSAVSSSGMLKIATHTKQRGTKKDMLPNITLKFTQWRRNYVAKIGFYVFARAICLGLLILSATSVQAMTKFSEEWIDDSNPNSGYVVGCGITRTEYYEDYHLITVRTTLTSPNGRTHIEYGFADGAGYKQPYIARAEALLAWDWNDVEGDYSAFSEHSSDCPLENFGTTSIALPVVLHAYKRDPPWSDEWIPTCTSSCTITPRWRNPNHRTPFIECGSIVIPYFGCGVALCSDSPVQGRCRG